MNMNKANGNGMLYSAVDRFISLYSVYKSKLSELLLLLFLILFQRVISLFVESGIGMEHLV